jgi:hypothetical protein
MKFTKIGKIWKELDQAKRMRPQLEPFLIISLEVTAV